MRVAGIPLALEEWETIISTQATKAQGILITGIDLIERSKEDSGLLNFPWVIAKSYTSVLLNIKERQ